MASLFSSLLSEYFILLEEEARLNCFSLEAGQRLPIFPDPSQTMQPLPGFTPLASLYQLFLFYVVWRQASRLSGLAAAMLCVLLAESIHTR